MLVFIIHRFGSRCDAVNFVREISKKRCIVLRPIVLENSADEDWRACALSRIGECEAVIVYDPAACQVSDNAVWEIKMAQELGKPIIFLDPKKLSDDELRKLDALYHVDEEFNSYFKKDGTGTETLYSIMVNSSEQLIQRRQNMNAFFITAIGSLMVIAGGLAKFGTVKSSEGSFVIMASFGIAGLLICNSWYKLIDNYGKLNAAKYRVILKIEETLSARIFSAEWAALGKGRRPKKYQSFTSTEKLVPLWFASLTLCLVLFISFGHVWHTWG